MSSSQESQDNSVSYQRRAAQLDTINTGSIPKSSSFRRSNSSSPTEEKKESHLSNRNSARSTDMQPEQTNGNAAGGHANTNSNMRSAPPPAPRGDHRHRRSMSGEAARVGLDQSSSHGSGNSSRNGSGELPPAQISFGTHGSMVGPPQMLGLPPSGPPGSGQHRHHHHHHRRAESWSGQYPPAAPPSPHYGSQGVINPMLPFFNDPNNMSETNPLLGGPQTQSTGRSSSYQRKRKSGSGQHRRSLSSGAAYPGMYGDFFKGEGTYDFPPPPPPSRSSQQFSPRTEFMKLAGRSPSSPSGRKMSPMPYQQSPHGTPRSNSMRGGFGNSMDPRVSFSPHVQVSPHPSNYGSMDMGNGPSMMPEFPMAAGGEAVFLAQKGGKHRESTRKRHMRQQSAQLFMENFKGTEQPLACRDIVFLLLFLFHIVGIAFLATTYSHNALDEKSQAQIGEGNVEIYYSSLMYVACMSGVFALVVSMLALGLMTVIARRFVQVALVLAVTISFAWGTIGVGLSPKNVVPISGFIALALTVAYSFIVWDRIPFCAANLVTALSGIRANLGTLAIAISFQILCFAYSIFLTFACVGVYDAIRENKLVLSHNMQVFVYTMLGVSFYWTYHVILNIVQVTTAGVIGDWWYDPENVHVFRSFSRTVFYSMGPICFGSLLVGPVRLIRQLSVICRPSAEDDSSLMCLYECLHAIQTCISSCVDGLYRHFNPWAYTYVGIYRYGFLDAGANATELFRTRGWTKIVMDDLVPNILMMTSVVIGGATGCFAHLIEHIDALHITSLDQPGAVSFCVGLVIGLVVTSVLLGIISSSVNTVLVCFAASPVDFESSHPELSHEMRAAWREVWPGCMDVVDLRVAMSGATTPNHSHRRSGSLGGSETIPSEFL